ncbi:MAG: NAD-dependent epimerase/dehydratase family protein [Selenomonadaceae bacterium]|nr:NAD-dependent epimerase/dehydratase family protein [Selenomonadaceae bacterium]
MKILFIGGNGNISWHCVQKAIDSGHEVFELNRAVTRNTRREVQPQVKQITADVRNDTAMKAALGDNVFDVICDFICFNGEQAKQAIQRFNGRIRQYVVISSEAVYRRESRFLPFTENTPQYDESVKDNYIAGKAQMEQVFRAAYEKEGFPVTIVRPGYTYDTIVPAPVGQNCFTAPQMFLNGYPLLMPGEGENLWSPLHSSDFAEAFVHLIGNISAVGEAYHITGERLITWNELAEDLLKALGANPANVIHIPRAEALNLGFHSRVVMEQHLWHYIFDNRKIKSVAKGWNQKITFSEGIKATIKWLFEDDVRRRINPIYEEKLNKLYEIYGKGNN